MDDLTALLFIVIVSNAGGEGKTLLAQLVQALLQLADKPVTLLDGDAGNRAAKVADDSTKVVGWGVDAIKAAEIVAATKGRHVIFDLGANSLASAREIVDLLPNLRTAYEVAGYRTIALLPVSTNKVGAVEAIKLLAPKLVGFEQAFVKVNRDGSRGYAGTLNSKNAVEMAHLAPGFQMYIREPGRTMASVISNPPAGDHLAPAYVAHWMRGFAQQPVVRNMLGPIPAYLAAYGESLDPLRFGVSSLAATTDTALMENGHKSRILTAIDEAGWSADGLRAVALLLDSGNI